MILASRLAGDDIATAIARVVVVMVILVLGGGGESGDDYRRTHRGADFLVVGHLVRLVAASGRRLWSLRQSGEEE